MDESIFNPQKKLKRTGFYYGPMALVLLFLVAVLIMSLFFRVSEIEVVNASDYSDREIVAASGIEKGVNLFFVDRFSAASMIFADLPYMDTVSIRRELPNKIVIQAEGSAPAVYLRLDEEYWLLDRRCKMLGVTSATKAEAYPEVRSLEPLTAMENMDMIVEGPNVERLAYAAELITALQGEGMLSDTLWIDVKDAANPSVYYDKRLTVYFGPMGDTARTAALLRDAVARLAPDDSGTLRYNGGSEWIFSPD
jgi:cell division protein FtsQ